ncbi:MAG TPA: hypothetical protein DIT84_07770 [Clostridiales bacterium]|nr:hypothetical protein [Clostridiales bacterium]
MQLKKRLAALLLALAMLVSLCGCDIYDVYDIYDAFFAEDDKSAAELISKTGNGGRDNIVSFDEMEYKRPDIDALKAKAQDVEDLLGNFFKVKDVIIELDKFVDLYNNFYTMMNLACVRYDMDTRDEFYFEEYSYCTEAAGDVEYLTDELLLDCSNSSMCDYLDKHFFGGLLTEQYSVTDGTGYTPSDELAELERKEAELENDYSELYAKYSGDFDSGKFKKPNEEIARIYIELIKLRHDIAEQRNMKSYEELAYLDNGRDYTAADLDGYIKAIKQYIVPLYKKADSKKMYDRSLVSAMSPKTALSTVTGTVEGLDKDIDEALGYMLKYKLYDTGMSDNKYDQSYVLYLNDYDSPFLFCSPSGYSDTVLTIVHEFGHYVDGYLNYGLNDSIDTSEVFSQGMEYLLLCNMDDAGQLTRYKMLAELELYAYQACLNEFEHRAYALGEKELTVETLNSLYSELLEEYGLTDDYKGLDWISITHLFTSPFYVISYCVSDSAAFELYNMELKKSGSGLEMYMKLLEESTSYDFLDLLEECGMSSAISADTVKEIAATLADKLDL